MATVTKDFRVKAGLVVEGATATVEGHNILTFPIEESCSVTPIPILASRSPLGQL